MPKIYSIWLNSKTNLILPNQQINGLAPAVPPEIQENSAQNVENQNLLPDGYVLVERPIKENSVRNVESQNLREFLNTVVTNADGNLKIQQNHQSFVQNVVIHLIMVI